jgi:brefeldin A-resistance guanine nucleotide exchange factor 1
MAALRTLQDAANKRTTYRLKMKQNEELPPPPGTTPKERTPLSYDAASVFLLEMMVSIASHTRQYIHDVW